MPLRIAAWESFKPDRCPDTGIVENRRFMQCVSKSPLILRRKTRRIFPSKNNYVHLTTGNSLENVVLSYMHTKAGVTLLCSNMQINAFIILP